MTTFTMRFALLLRAGRRLADTLSAMHNMTPQDRADHYVANMPIAVLAR